MSRRVRIEALSALLVLSAALLSAAPARAVGDETEGARAAFPAHFTAPYVGLWDPPDSLAAAGAAAGLRYFTLGFVIGDGGCHVVYDGMSAGALPDWLAAVSRLRAAGGDVIVSFGGGGRELAPDCATVDALKAAYRSVVDTFALTRIDFDVEGDTLDDRQANDRRNEALAELRQEYAAAGHDLAVQYTLPVNPWGLSPDALDLLRSAQAHHLDVDVVNIMTMNYGDELDMGAAATAAAAGLHSQLAQIWPEKSADRLWAMEGNTPMIGLNGGGKEVFSTGDAGRLAAFAAEQGIRLLSFWSLGRDKACAVEGTRSETCSGTAQSPYAFSRILGSANG
ncbi:chitinase [Kitasatospora sp. NBC_01250]|uniref:chitinase n=1 Tax=unclassified Kitasatospora TaxID=2633591 RepID=UPI002E0E98E4|nr:MULTISPECIES: chitinase [unclassified Kitasatospora]WSJ65501.1 chitinase [Kitasatospora sp. NBC_01302]